MGRHSAPVVMSTSRKITTAAAAAGAVFGAGQLFATATAAADTTGGFGAVPPELEAMLPAGFELPQIALPEVQLPQVQLPEGPGAPVISWPAAPQDVIGGAIASTYQPVKGTLTSGYGPRWGSHHGGVDVAAPIGTEIRSAASGTVINAGPANGYGLWVQILHDDGTVATYGHIDSYSVAKGQTVAAGDRIATVGNRGQSTGPHLHFEVWDPSASKIDPIAWLQTRGVNPDWAISA